jgi:ribulose-phosphate 3-epimerase
MSSQWIESFVQAGADVITLHIEACSPLKLKALLKRIRSHGLLSGISLNPKTPLSRIKTLLAEVDLVLVMSVQPGFGGQSFKPEVLTKVRELAKLQEKYDYFIEIDGGINDQTIGLASEAGAEIFVAGHAIYSHKDRKKAVCSLTKAAFSKPQKQPKKITPRDSL